MSHNILVTGASGYLGGTLLARWASAKLPTYQRHFALVRTDEQSEAVKKYGAEPIKFNIKDQASVQMIKALAEVKKQTGQDVHFLHTSGAKLFSSHAGLPTNSPIPDNDPALYYLSKITYARYLFVEKAVMANNTIIETALEYDVKSYLFVPCVVYGKGEGFGNKTSIQTVAIVNAAKKLRRVCRPDPGYYTWPVSHVSDTAGLYLEIIWSSLSGKEIDHGINGYYLASSGNVSWNSLYTAMAKRLAAQNIIDNDKVALADDQALESMGAALGCPKDMVSLFLGGKCTLQAKHGREIGWTPQYSAEHILEMADAEVDLILQNP
ncbi:hypothetical protein N7481_001886 [Penicillium waksmanii]|uniref:uncharacterized protein n=1 Tax=Penicillium waksmanii TaxID=69791 RepID=UPI0025469E82|nr:uncharacterized protein N7481_001886 [Penicillium waksmanii]KAJ5994909.1 hypothetical protein N7481_001886 [Penicillium waksmanii]